MALVASLLHKRKVVLSFCCILFMFILLIVSIDLFRDAESVDFGLHGTSAPAGYILPERSLRQELTVQFSGRIDEVKLLVATYGRPDYHLNDATVRVELTNLNTGRIVSEDLAISDFVDNSFYSIIIRKAFQVRAGDKIAVELIAVDTNESNAPTIWLFSELIMDNELVQPASAGSQRLSGGFGMALSYSLFDSSRMVLAALLLCAVAIVIFLSHRKPHPIRFNKFRALLSRVLVMVVFPVVTFLLFQNMVLQENHTNKWNIIFPLVAYLSLYVIAYLVFGRFGWAYLFTNAQFLAVYIANAGKRGVRGDVFLPSDLFAVSEASKYTQADMIHFVINSGLVIFLLLSVLIWQLTSRFLTARLRRYWGTRIISATLVFALFSTMMVQIVYKDDVLRDEYGVTNVCWDQNDNVEQNGLFQVFLMNSDVLFINIPKGYSQKAVTEVIENVSNRTHVDPNQGIVTSHSMPDNIIVIMNESFYDLSQVEPQLEKYDAMPYVQDLMQKNISGQTIVPVIAGGTCNSEFEFLTGFSSVFLPSGSLPYQQYIHQSIPTLSTVMKDMGYKTIATHPNSPSMWNRDRVYDLFGFDDFYSSGTYGALIGEAGMNRGVYTDRSVYDIVLNEIDQSDAPTFVFAVTIQNHFPYSLIGDEVEYNVTGEDELDPDVKGFMNLIRQSDEDFRYLIEALERRDETTVVLFFGDHAPPMGAGFYEQLPDDRFLDKYATPYLIYATSNYKLAYDGPSFERLSLNYLGYYFLDVLGVDTGIFHAVLRDAYKEDPIFSIYREDIATDTTDLKDYEMLQYYYLFGKSQD